MLVIAVAALCPRVFGETETIQPQGVYATIDTASSMQAIDALRDGTAEQRANAASDVIAHPDRYCPAVFFSLAAALFDDGKTGDAIFWLYAGRIRTQFDIRRCTDETVAGGYDDLNGSVPDLLRLIQFEDPEGTAKIVEKALEWDRRTPYNYDPRWIALHGMGAVMSATAQQQKEAPLTVPEKGWPALAEKNRREYRDAFREDMAGITPEQLRQVREQIQAMKKGSAAAKKQ